MQIKRYNLSLCSWVLGATILCLTVFNEEMAQPRSNPFRDDVQFYYAYLPALFIHHDIYLHYAESDSSVRQWQVDPLKLPNGNNLIKMTCGTAVYYFPFFILAHGYALLTDDATGYSMPYEVLLILGGAFYSIFALFILRKILLRYFSDGVTAITIASVMLGTNLFYYSAYEGLMSHVYVFFTLVMVIWFTMKFHDKPTIINSIALGFFCGMSLLIRPNNGLFIVFPLLYNVTSVKTLRAKWQLLLSNYKRISAGMLVFLIPCSLQLWYWKIITGHWIFYSYLGEPFYFNDPQFLNGLFSYRKGWLVYTPIMIFSIAGIFVSYRKLKSFYIPMVVVLALESCIIFSWWCWWYGGSFGLRAMIDLYSLLVFPMATCYEKLFMRNWTRYFTIAFSSLLIALNLFQTAQYRNGIIHYDSMTKEAYWYVFLKPSLNPDERKKLEDLIEFPHYDWWKDREKFKEQLKTEHLLP